MKKTFGIIALVSLLCIALVSAEIITYLPTPEEKIIAGSITPESQLYFLDVWWDNMVINSKTGMAKVQARLSVLEERAIEANIMAESDKADARDAALVEHGKQLAEISNDQLGIEDTQKNIVSEALQKHLLVLQGVLAKVPVAARAGIQNAINNSQNAFDKTFHNTTADKRRSLDDIKTDVEEKERGQSTILTNVRGTK